jgi:hypothetical protein
MEDRKARAGAAGVLTHVRLLQMSVERTGTEFAIRRRLTLVGDNSEIQWSGVGECLGCRRNPRRAD